MDYRGINGFLPGSRASIMLDVVFLAMFVVIPVMVWSIWLVKYRRRYALHRTIQTTLGIVLLLAVVLFELDMQFVSGWLDRAAPSPYFDVTFDRNGNVSSSGGWGFLTLYIHLAVAVTSAVLWVLVLVRAWRNFGPEVQPNAHSRWHIRWAWVAAIAMTLTAVTGWTFYLQAFVAR